MKIQHTNPENREHRILIQLSKAECDLWHNLLVSLHVQSAEPAEQRLVEHRIDEDCEAVNLNQQINQDSNQQVQSQSIHWVIFLKKRQLADGSNASDSRALLSHPERHEWVLTLQLNMAAIKTLEQWLKQSEPDNNQISLDQALGRRGLGFPSNVEVIFKKEA